MTSAEALKALRDKGCVYLPADGYHFKGISGRHLSGYCNIDPSMPHVTLISRMTEAIVDPFVDDDVEVVFAPAVGAIPMAHWGSHHLSTRTKKDVSGIWADKVKPRGFQIERAGFAEALKGKRVLVLEDMINQMFSVRELVRLVEEMGGYTVGVGSIASNRNVTAEAIGVPKLFSLTEVGYDAWDEDACELCSKKVPMVTDIGHGDEFVAERPGYPGITIVSLTA